MKSQKLTIPKNQGRKWILIDVSKQSLGRAASEIAKILRGKHKRDFTPHQDCGDYVVAINAGKLMLTGRKASQKVYYRHSGYLGGLHKETMSNLLAQKPQEVLKKAVFSMLDEVKFRKAMMARLKIVVTDKHDYKIDKTI